MKKVIFLSLMGLMAFSMQAQDYAVDLGLPSKTKWESQNAKGFYTYAEAVNQFGIRLPTKEQWEELKTECQWLWTGSGYKVTGPNGNSITLSAAGDRYPSGKLDGAGSYGSYWSSSPDDSDFAWLLYFSSRSVTMSRYLRDQGLSVRLVQSSSYGNSLKTKSPQKMVVQGYTDLGLPSGTIWKNFNDTGFYSYNEAVNQFGNRMPTKEQWEELKAECQWFWTGSSYKITGPNGNSIYLPVLGGRSCNGYTSGAGSYGGYWSSTPFRSDHAWYLGSYSGEVYMNRASRCSGYSVRLVQD
ncbi:MAG: hypothetical protein SPL12_09740 [Bacteroidales bacterium]|nr:hypothetical protein [Bacteroidales bacterium]